MNLLFIVERSKLFLSKQWKNLCIFLIQILTAARYYCIFLFVLITKSNEQRWCLFCWNCNTFSFSNLTRQYIPFSKVSVISLHENIIEKMMYKYYATKYCHWITMALFRTSHKEKLTCFSNYVHVLTYIHANYSSCL